MKEIIKINLLNYIVLIFFEAMFALISFDIYSKGEVLSILIYSLFVSFVMTILMTIWSEKVNRIFGYIIYFIFCFWFALETIFKAFLQTFFSLDCFKLSDQAMGFAGETIKVIVGNIHYLILFFLPFILLIIFRKKIDLNIKENKKYLYSYIILIPLSFLSYRLYINSTKDNKDISLYDLYYNTNNIPLSIQKMGVLSSTGLDIYRNIFGFEDKVIEVNYEEENNDEDLFVYEKNNLDLDLSSNKLNKDIKEYIDNNPGTSKNKYTGMFENKNLIFVVAESFSEIGIDKDRTPTLYKLTNNGFIFDNFYVPYYLSTIGGEFQSLTGLYPNYSTLTKWKSGKNSFPYGLATTFKEKGYNTYAYHAHDGYFQNRYKYLKALGFDNFKACNMGLNINCNMWPESDIEMIKATTNDYINSDKPFMTYYMTVSGHLDYTKEGNSIVSKNWDLVKNLDYSDKAKSYLATQIELDRAMESLLKELENKGILEDTVIVLLADHYPYGLSLEEINELSSYKRDELFEINHNALIIYNSSMKNISITKVGMPIDVLPTIYNLFDIKYDSRLFAGSDLLSNNEGMVILDNLSWITDKGKYNSLNGKYSGDIDSDYINNINNIIQNKIIFSRNMITYDGYRYIKEK
ncbi:MAG: LTA synthase family protein [Bacilli bacterium]|jgi:arylsulfatase